MSDEQAKRELKIGTIAAVVAFIALFLWAATGCILRPNIYVVFDKDGKSVISAEHPSTQPVEPPPGSLREFLHAKGL